MPETVKSTDTPSLTGPLGNGTITDGGIVGSRPADRHERTRGIYREFGEKQ